MSLVRTHGEVGGRSGMTDREKVIKGLEQHISYKCETDDIPKGICPYWECEYCINEVMRNALELLKEQEPIEAKTMGESKSHGSWWFACGACGHAIDPEDNFCRECGRKVKWDG